MFVLREICEIVLIQRVINRDFSQFSKIIHCFFLRTLQKNMTFFTLSVHRGDVISVPLVI